MKRGVLWQLGKGGCVIYDIIFSMLLRYLGR